MGVILVEMKLLIEVLTKIDKFSREESINSWEQEQSVQSYEKPMFGGKELMSSHQRDKQNKKSVR